MRVKITPVSRAAKVGWNAPKLPRWPFALPFIGYLPAVALGVGNLVWAIAAAIMLAVLLRSRSVRVPRGLGIWLLFLFWVLFSLIMVDSLGRGLGAIYRWGLYLSATVIAVYVFNAWRTLTPRYISGVLTWFLAGITLGGYLAILFPLLSFRTPMSYLVPGSLASNELISEMIVVTTTQWNPDAWVVSAPRPSAPFLYTNTWGNVYSLVLPLAVAYLITVWKERRRRWCVLGLIIVSLVPAAATLNRGMLVGLGVVALWCGVQALRGGRLMPLLGGAAAGALIAMIWALSPANENLSDRLETSETSEDRSELYQATIQQVLESPFFGFGAPRPAEEAWLPSLGTHGQLWLVLFSYGFVGAALFMGFFLFTFVKGIRRMDAFGAICCGVVLATFVEAFYYGMMTGINISLVAAILLLRSDGFSSHHPDGKQPP